MLTVDATQLTEYCLMEYGRELENLWDKLPGGMFSPLDCMTLFGFARFTKPTKILEIGSLLGKSTAILCQAIENNGLGALYTCDIDEKSTITKKNIDRLFPNNNTVYISGDVYQNLDKIPNDLDFVFLDGPHNAEFMQWCVDNILPKTKSGCPVCIHDINLSYNWNYRVTPGCETDCLVRLQSEGKLPLQKVAWMEDWCLNHTFRPIRERVYDDFPIIGEWGILTYPNISSLSVWYKI